LSRPDAQALCETFAPFRPTLVERPLADFSRLRFGAAGYCEVAPRATGVVSQIVQAAHERGAPLRLRAQGHSLNGATLPDAGELLLSTRYFRGVRFEEPGTVTAGCGVVLWILQHVLRRHGFDLPVLNDGYPGPSIGGYLAAGGFGPRSGLYGGFWDNVREVAMVDGSGRLRRIGAGDPLFPWLFGSMGQLGVFVGAKLAIIPRPDVPPTPYPAGRTLVAPELAAPKVPAEFATGDDESLFWFTLFVPDENLDRAQRELTSLERAHGAALRFQERYSYPIRSRGLMPPLIYPQARPITATGAWGWLSDQSTGGVEKLREFDRQFGTLAASEPHYRRYVQSELPAGPAVYERCFGPPVYAEFRRLKAELDPAALFNRGTVFPV
jgi:FAD/FMN-containing dehydrogenase